MDSDDESMQLVEVFECYLKVDMMMMTLLNTEE
jgi:hypothetical protein